MKNRRDLRMFVASWGRSPQIRGLERQTNRTDRKDGIKAWLWQGDRPPLSQGLKQRREGGSFEVENGEDRRGRKDRKEEEGDS